MVNDVGGAEKKALSRLLTLGRKARAVPGLAKEKAVAAGGAVKEQTYGRIEKRKAFYRPEKALGGGGFWGRKKFEGGKGEKFSRFVCPECKGTGKCSDCRGTGKVMYYDEIAHEERATSVNCKYCKGSGKCPACAGTGKKGGGLARRAGRGAWRGAKAAPGAAGKAGRWLKEKAPSADSTLTGLKHVAVIIIVLLVIGISFLGIKFFGGAGASKIGTQSGMSLESIGDKIEVWWSQKVECAIDPSRCMTEAAVVEGTENAGIELVGLKPDSKYFDRGEEVVFGGAVNYTSWTSPWGLKSPEAKAVKVKITAETFNKYQGILQDKILQGPWTCSSPENLAKPDFTCTHAPVEDWWYETGRGEMKSVGVAVYATYNFTTMGERKLYVMQRNEYYRKENPLAEAQYTAEETTRTVGGPVKLTIGSDREWDDVIKLPMTTAESLDISILNAEEGDMTLKKVTIGIPTYILTKGIELDCHGGQRYEKDEITYCTRSMSEPVGQGESAGVKIKLKFSDSSVEKGIMALPMFGSVEYLYKTSGTVIVGLAKEASGEWEDKSLTEKLFD